MVSLEGLKKAVDELQRCINELKTSTSEHNHIWESDSLGRVIAYTNERRSLPFLKCGVCGKSVNITFQRPTT